jgi:arylsulfatase A-like enzyme
VIFHPPHRRRSSHTPPWRHPTAAPVIAALVGVAALSACESRSSPTREPVSHATNPTVTAATAAREDVARSGRSIARYTDLLRLAEEDPVAGTHASTVHVWDLGRHHRPVLEQRPGTQIQLGPIGAGTGCTMRFGIAVSSAARSRGTALRFAVEMRQRARRTTFFDEHIAARPVRADEHSGTGSWRDYEVQIPHDDGSPFFLVFHVEPGEGRAPRAADRGGWSAPHVICTVDRRKPAPLPYPHVVLISLDTLRRDHLGIYGYARPTSPTLDEFARQALVFDRAFTPAPWTLPSHASMFTGRYPNEHGAGHRSLFAPLEPTVPTLAEILAGAGYRTIAFTAAGLVSRRHGLSRGFESWTERLRPHLGAVLPAVFDAMGVAPDRPLFLFLHTYDLHAPYHYLPAPPAFRLSADGDGGADTSNDGDWERLLRSTYHAHHHLDRFSNLEDVVAAYDSGIRSVDRQLDVLFDRLRDLGIYDNALIIVTSDHGESLHDRRLYLGHGCSLRDEEIRVPLLVRLPRSSMTGRVSELVDLVDLAPMVLEIAGLAHDHEFSGSNPLRRIAGDIAPRTFVRGEAAHTGSRFVRSREWKVVTAPHPKGDARSRVPRDLRDRFPYTGYIFALASDPGEHHDLSDETEPATGASAGELDRLRRLVEIPTQPTTTSAELSGLSETAIDQLRALGYVE